jgi:NAD(P)H-hydrate epimerase|nr:NAD(P)H-hydrate dehydratase [uncultured Flavobacterium sp.]
MKALSKSYIKSILKPREASSHKGSHGHALLIAGSKGFMGSSVIASRACLRSGAGLLTVNIPEEERFILQTAIPEAMLVMRENTISDLNNFSAIGIGPGLGTGKESVEILVSILNDFNKRILLDADALNCISSNKSLLEKIPKETIITPHPKEFDRLFGTHKDNNERMNTAIQKSKELKITIVLKGHHTLITYNGDTFYNTTGNAGLAKGGSGDALTGIILSFLAQGYDPFGAAKLGVYLHGFAADLTLKKQSMESMLITDVIESLGKALKKTME